MKQGGASLGCLLGWKSWQGVWVCRARDDELGWEVKDCARFSGVKDRRATQQRPLP